MPLGTNVPGKVVRGSDPRARKPAAGHVSRANALGGVLQGVESVGLRLSFGRRLRNDTRGDGLAYSPSSGKCSSELLLVSRAISRACVRVDRIRHCGAGPPPQLRRLPCSVAVWTRQREAKQRQAPSKKPRSFLERSSGRIGTQSRNKAAS